jgi:FSR family fosmidomycin resistance protein-like MFS transporter
MKENLLTRKILLPVLVLWFGHFSTDFMIGMWSIYKTVAGLDIALAGLIAGVAAGIGEGMQFFFGPYSDHGNRKKLIIIGSILLMADSLLGFTDSYWIYFLLFLTTCLGSGMFHPSAGGTIGDLTKKNRGLLFTLFASGGFIGLACSHLIFTKVYQSTEGSTLFLALPSLIFLALVSFIDLPEKQASNRPKLLTIFKLFKDPEMLRLYITIAANQSIYWAMIFMLPDLLMARGYSQDICYGIGNLFFIMGSALSMLPAGYIADRYSPRVVMLTASSVGLIAFYTLIGSPLLSSGALLGVLMVLGAAMGVIAPVGVSLGTGLHPDKPGMVNAFLMGMVWCVAEAVGPGLGGLATGLFEEAPVAKALSLVGMLYFVSLYQIYHLPKVAEAKEQVI